MFCTLYYLLRPHDCSYKSRTTTATFNKRITTNSQKKLRDEEKTNKHKCLSFLLVCFASHVRSENYRYMNNGRRWITLTHFFYCSQRAMFGKGMKPFRHSRALCKTNFTFYVFKNQMIRSRFRAITWFKKKCRGQRSLSSGFPVRLIPFLEMIKKYEWKWIFLSRNVFIFCT